ncbi:MAG: TlpA disulfide reductase family protein [Anaeromyxobacteraceae bacterium]
MRYAVIALCASLALPSVCVAEEEIAVGLPAPAFSLRTMNPEVAGTGWLALDKYAGEQPEDAGSRLVVLSFFASWCGPCKKEMPFLAQLDTMYRPQGLRIVGVSIDTEEPGMAAARKMIAENKVAYPVVSDRFNFLARRYLGASAPLPSLFLVRRDGTIVRIERGYSKDVGALLLSSIQQELGVKAAPAAVAGSKASDARSSAKHPGRTDAKSAARAGARPPAATKPGATTPPES